MKYDFNFFDISPDNVGTIEVEPKQWTMESMKREIQSLSSMETLMEQETAVAGLLSTCEAELTIKQLACRDAVGKTAEEAEEVFANYGLVDEYSTEAAKDVLARGAYISSAKIKTMIAAVLKYIQELITFSSTTNKGFKSLEKLAKKAKESLRKKQGSPKVTSDKFTREILNITSTENKAAIDKVLTNKESVSNAIAGASSRDTLLETATEFVKGVLKENGHSTVDLKKPLDAISDIRSDWKTELEDAADAIKDKEEFEKGSLLAKVIENLAYVETTSKTLSKDKILKELEKMKTKLSKFTSDSYIKKNFKSNGKTTIKDSQGNELFKDVDAGELQTIIQNFMQIVGLVISNTKSTDKLILKAFDNALTEAKAVEAMLA